MRVSPRGQSSANITNARRWELPLATVDVPCVSRSCFLNTLLGLFPAVSQYCLSLLSEMSFRFAGPYDAGSTLTSAHQTGKILCISFSPLVDFIATGSDDGFVTIWNVTSGEMLCQRGTPEPVTSILWHPSWRSVLFVGCQEGDAFAWNFRVFLHSFIPVFLIELIKHLEE